MSSEKAEGRDAGRVLLPCPFCGGAAEIRTHEWKEGDTHAVWCIVCGASTLGTSDKRSTAAEWNYRAKENQPGQQGREGLIQRLSHRIMLYAAQRSPAMMNQFTIEDIIREEIEKGRALGGGESCNVD